jgi:hypothetical protein
MIKLKEMRWNGHVARVGQMMYVYKIVVEKSERKRSLERSKHRCDGNIKMHL